MAENKKSDGVTARFYRHMQDEQKKDTNDVFTVSMKKIYFATKDGGIVDSYDLAKASLIIAGEGLDCENLDAVRRFALACAGVVREVDNPSVKYLVANGFKVKAVSLWRDKHPGSTLKEAYSAVNRMEKNLTRMYKKGAEEEKGNG